MLLSEAIPQYIDHIRVERGLSPRTIHGNQSWLRHYLHWLEGNGYTDPTIDQIAEPVLLRYLHYLNRKGFRPRTILGVFYPIRALGDYLVLSGHLEGNPARLVVLPKRDAANRKVTTDQEAMQLLQACERQAEPRQIALSRGMLSVLIYTGLRRQELLDLKLADFILEDKSVLVRSGKGRKSRRVYPCSECVTAVTEWLALRGDASHDWLWALDRNRRVHQTGFTSMLRRIKAIAGLKDAEHIQPHSLRHAAATRLLRNGANIRDIQTFLGHTNLNTTAIYLHSDEERLRDLANLGAIRQDRADQLQNNRPVNSSFRRRVAMRR